VELLERKGLCTKHDRYGIITEFRRKNPSLNLAARDADRDMQIMVQSAGLAGLY
jgi:hypothetical protein